MTLNKKMLSGLLILGGVVIGTAGSIALVAKAQTPSATIAPVAVVTPAAASTQVSTTVDTPEVGDVADTPEVAGAADKETNDDHAIVAGDTADQSGAQDAGQDGENAAQ